ncbi:DNA polymerase III subunit epsilon [Acidiferrobacter sp.]|uniref:DNA polymerase III subunit epsilon n=1 Tax=Acidiferrobacter sp. TaxID=1872107 RepID=UPI00260D2A7E|nr:DNA polymerase III subunit epsilon [Acidiferrobacter sp.]
MTRQVVLDTETTGLESSEGHRIIEVGAIELKDRRLTGRRFHRYLNPDREIDAAAIEVHGITNAMLADKPHFADIAAELLAFIEGAELLIHNAAFDAGFLNAELARARAQGCVLPVAAIEECCTIQDTLRLARTLHPGQKNSLDALCRRYSIDNSQRVVHGALLDAEILTDVYLAMTGGQMAMFGEEAAVTGAAIATAATTAEGLVCERGEPLVIMPSAEELAAHEACLETLDKKSGGRCLWRLLG